MVEARVGEAMPPVEAQPAPMTPIPARFIPRTPWSKDQSTPMMRAVKTICLTNSAPPWCRFGFGGQAWDGSNGTASATLPSAR